MRIGLPACPTTRRFERIAGGVHISVRCAHDGVGGAFSHNGNRNQALVTDRGRGWVWLRRKKEGWDMQIPTKVVDDPYPVIRMIHKVHPSFQRTEAASTRPEAEKFEIFGL